MEQAKAILKRIFFLPPLPNLCIALPSFALVIYVLDQGFLGPLAYAVYVLSAYALVISITGGSGIIAGFVQYDGVERHAVYPRHHHRRCRDRWYLRCISAVSVRNEKAAG